MQRQAQSERPLAGKRAWLFTTGAAGMDVQTRGVADALGLIYEMKPMAPRGLHKLLSPWAPVAARERFGQPGSDFAPPWPDVAIGLGRLAVPYVRAVRRHSPGTFTMMMLDTRAGLGAADVIWVPEHDPLRGPNVVTTLTAPHSITPERLAELRQSLPEDIAGLPRPRVAVILGGTNSAYTYTAANEAAFGEALRSLGALGAGLMITPSRRTHASLLSTVDSATREVPRILWDQQGANPYGRFLAHADLLVVTADSVNMTGEAAATGKPVLVFTPSGGTAKFRRFHAALHKHGATRSLTGPLQSLPAWSYEPLQSADTIAREVERRWLRAKAG